MPDTPITRKSFVVLMNPDDNIPFTIPRSPSFGNQYITNFNHIQKESRGKTLILAANDTYYSVKSIKSLSLRFEYISQQVGQGLLDFVNKNLGLLIKLTDHEDFTFDGFITTPELELVQQDKNNYSVEFDFEIASGIDTQPPTPPF